MLRKSAEPSLVLLPTLGEVEVSFDAAHVLLIAGAPLLNGDLQKGAGHKYIRRERVNGKWKYYYNTTANVRSVSADVEEGTSLQIAHEGQSGHFKVDRVKGDRLTMTHSDSGKTVTVSRDELARMRHKEHGKAIRAKQKQHESDLKVLAAQAARD